MVTIEFIQSRHSRPQISCRYPKCNATFTRKTDGIRHEQQIHEPTKLYCKISGCRFRGTVRQEVMRKHLKTKHPFEGKLFESQSRLVNLVSLTVVKLKASFKSTRTSPNMAHLLSRAHLNLLLGRPLRPNPKPPRVRI